MLEILAVEPHSIAAELDLRPGDALLSINGEPLRDLLDFLLHDADEEMLLEVRKADGELWDLELEKDAGEPLGLHFEHPQPSHCGNNCIFCFVHQLPRGMRRTLYVKDEDYRFSFLYGAYVTLTNIGEAEIERILRQRLSPLYVSVHATDEQIRQRLIGRPGRPILELLQRLAGGGIELHTQIVVCPGINDGSELERTAEDLAALHPGVRSLAIVPVGLTGFRQRLHHLRVPTAAEAKATLQWLHGFQERMRREKGTRFAFAADEYYLKADLPFPPLEDFEDLPQIENGVGMVPLFRAEAEQVLAQVAPLRLPPVSTLTGESFARELNAFLSLLEAKAGVRITLFPVRNAFFAGDVTVTGLLTGQDIVAQLRGKDLGEVLLIPDVVLKEGEEILLDDLSLTDLERELGVKVRAVGTSPLQLWEALEELAG